MGLVLVCRADMNAKSSANRMGEMWCGMIESLLFMVTRNRMLPNGDPWGCRFVWGVLRKVDR